MESQEHFIALGAMPVVALAISHLATGLRRESRPRAAERTARASCRSWLPSRANAASHDQVLALAAPRSGSRFAGPCVLAPHAGGRPLRSARRRRRHGARRQVACVREGPCCGRALGAGPARTPGSFRWAKRAA
ncbi:hypothetical protein [Candidatus Skiveiella danica]|uniref:hypothetical protein n=1 Tax=Candidatus Skiveiella danica TaxID=3386177 RepID=UPI0039B88E21